MIYRYRYLCYLPIYRERDRKKETEKERLLQGIGSKLHGL